MEIKLDDGRVIQLEVGEGQQVAEVVVAARAVSIDGEQDELTTGSVGIFGGKCSSTVAIGLLASALQLNNQWTEADDGLEE